MEPSYLQIRAMASEFDGGADYREETKAAAYQPQQHAPPGRRVRQPKPRGRRRQPMHPKADWAGVVPPETKKKIVTTTAKQPALGAGLLPVGEERRTQHRKHFENDVRFASVDPGAQGAPLNSAAYQLGPGGRHSAAEWQSEARAQMAMEAASRARPSKKKLFGEVGPDAALPGSDRAARATLQRAREMEVRGGAAAAASISRGGPPRVAAATLGSRRGPNSLLSGIGAKIGYSSAVRAAGAAVKPNPTTTRAHVAIPGYQGHRPERGPLANSGGAPPRTQPQQQRSSRPW